MPLSKEDLDQVRESLGLEEGKGLTDLIGDSINGALNSYDKRSKKDREKLDGQLTELSDGLKTLAEAKPKDPPKDPPKDAKPGDLPPEVQERMDSMEAASKKLADDLEAERSARKERDDQIAAQDTAQKRRDMLDAVKTAALTKDVFGADPDMIDILVGHLERTEMIRQREDGKGYEMLSGKDKITGDDVFKPLEDGFKDFAASTVGKKFLPAVPGGGGGVPPKVPGGPGGENQVAASEFMAANPTPEQIREAADGGRLDYSR